jgi:phenylalanyl-tRNA synthetase alpha chain
MSDAVDRVGELLARFQQEREGVASRQAWEALKGKYLNREHGLLPAIFAELKTISGPEKAQLGKSLNLAKREIEKALGLLGAEVERIEAARKAASRVDVTLPARPRPRGGLHPVTAMRRKIEDVFLRLGYSIADGPELETDYYNFEALNFPADHPARDTQDTLLIAAGAGAPGHLLRTHTSPVQIRAMKRYGAPLRIVIPGRVYRKDDIDPTHSPMFHQVEGLLVDRGVTMGHLKGTLEAFVEGVFGAGTRARFSCSYFPFVEPGAQVDMSCIFCKGSGCRTCKGSGWIEILGAGMVHPNVLRAGGIDPETHSGFAFGMGIDRLVMLKYGIPDLRLLFDNDVRFLAQMAEAE